MNRYLFFPSIFILLLAGCRHRENVSQLKAINQSLQNSNSIIQDDCRLIYEVMQEKLKDPRTTMRTQIWMPSLEKIQGQTDSIKAEIKRLKNDLLKQTDSLREEKAAIIKALSEPARSGYALLNRVATFKDSIPAIFNANDFKIDNPTFYADIIRLCAFVSLLPSYTDSLSKPQRTQYIEKWLEDNFAGSSSLMAMIVLNKMENDVLATEKLLIEYCNNQTVTINCGYYEEFHAITSLSTSYVKRGQTIEITAGVAAFSAAARPRITIDNKEIKLNNYTTSVHRFTANGKSGKHIVPITIEYWRPGGTKERASKDLVYIIAEEK